MKRPRISKPSIQPPSDNVARTTLVATLEERVSDIEGVQVFPVGYIWVSNSSINPALICGYGTWTQVSQGRFLIGQQSGTVYSPAGATGGSPTITAAGNISTPAISGLSGAEAAHTHPVTSELVTVLEGDGIEVVKLVEADTGPGTSHSHSPGTLAISAQTFTGSPTSFVPPYFVAYFFQRTA